MATKRITKTTSKISTTSAPRVTRSAGTKSASVKQIDRDTIAKRAYELFVARGGQNGHDVDDWLIAERELVAH